MMAQDFNPAIFQAALLEVAEATKAATTAVQAMQAAQQQQPASPQVQPAAVTGSPTGSPGGATDWSKLVNKPPLLDGKTVEDEIRMFRDWLWMLTQFLNTIDLQLLQRRDSVEPNSNVCWLHCAATDR